MTVLTITTSPDPILRKKARKIRTISTAIETVIEDMIETLRVAPGVGLAAPQVGVSQRLIVAEFSEPSEDPEAPPKPPKLYVILNPEIVRHSADTNLDNEGCLSIPGYMGEVERYDTATIKGMDRNGRDFRLKAKGWLARILQHEIDHLEGILFIDKATSVWKLEEENVSGDVAVA